ncbi:hypothetical protein PybrP1_000343 [[Pythium] brassicae (nom. inval.)]|nr:hypothetical protein PybrP1_000343 [[Pythium] brassicae (nom. inval.)]
MSARQSASPATVATLHTPTPHCVTTSFVHTSSAITTKVWEAHETDGQQVDTGSSSFELRSKAMARKRFTPDDVLELEAPTDGA